jgi:lysozyme family protein
MTVQELIKTAKLKNLSWYEQKLVPKIIKNKNIYFEVQEKTGVPAGFLAAVHTRENGPDVGVFKTYLGNGQSLNRVTTIVPKGRGPFKNWVEGAIDAIKLVELDEVKKWDLEQAIYQWEKYNGFGYKARGKLSPYVWTGTQHGGNTGYFTSDGKYSATAKDNGIGCFALYTLLTRQDSDFIIGNDPIIIKDEPKNIQNPLAIFLSWVIDLFKSKKV